MLMTQVTDRKLFLDTVKKTKAEVRVYRTTTNIPEIVEGHRVTMVPALLVQGTIEFVDEHGTQCRWIYKQEKRWDDSFYDEMGRLSDKRMYAGTLWEDLERLVYADIDDGVTPPKVRLVHRTGSF